MKTVHFPPVEDPAQNGDARVFPAARKPTKDPAALQISKNPYEAFSALYRDHNLISTEIKGFLASNNRHGAIEVINSALIRMLENIAVMRAVEEEL